MCVVVTFNFPLKVGKGDFMKKLVHLSSMLLIIGLVILSCEEGPNDVGITGPEQISGSPTLRGAKHTESDPFIKDLIAGQHIDVGDVKVWNDADYLYLKYIVDTEGWCITETHLHVAISLEDIPQTKKGNPIPGQFDYKEEHDCVTEYTYEIPLEWDPSDELFIATHAVVVQPIDGCFETVWQIGDVEEDPNSSKSLSDEFAGNHLGQVVDYYIPPNDYNKNFPTAFVPTNYDDGYPYAHPDKEFFTELVNIYYAAYLPFGGQLSWRWTAGNSGSEEYDVIWNSDILGAFADLGLPKPNEGFYAHELSIPSYNGDQVISFARTDEWHAPGDGDGGRWDWIRLEKPCEQSETAWGAGFDFPGKNWATYFTYTVQCPYEPDLVNGGFETPVVTDVKGWDIFTTSQVGWTVEWAGEYEGAPDDAYLEIHRGVNDWLPHEVKQHAELDTDWQGPGSAGGEQASVRISQNLQTCAGWNYKVSFAYSPRPGHDDNILKVYWGGTLVQTYSADGSSNTNTAWTEVDLTLTASGSTTELAFVEAGKPDSYGMFIDAVSVEK